MIVGSIILNPPLEDTVKEIVGTFTVVESPSTKPSTDVSVLVVDDEVGGVLVVIVSSGFGMEMKDDELWRTSGPSAVESREIVGIVSIRVELSVSGPLPLNVIDDGDWKGVEVVMLEFDSVPAPPEMSRIWR